MKLPDLSKVFQSRQELLYFVFTALGTIPGFLLSTFCMPGTIKRLGGTLRAFYVLLISIVYGLIIASALVSSNMTVLWVLALITCALLFACLIEAIACFYIFNERPHLIRGYHILLLGRTEDLLTWIPIVMKKFPGVKLICGEERRPTWLHPWPIRWSFAWGWYGMVKVLPLDRLRIDFNMLQVLIESRSTVFSPFLIIICSPRLMSFKGQPLVSEIAPTNLLGRFIPDSSRMINVGKAHKNVANKPFYFQKAAFEGAIGEMPYHLLVGQDIDLE